jgi:hypothetical protein
MRAHSQRRDRKRIRSGATRDMHRRNSRSKPEVGTSGRSALPVIAYWDFDAVGGDGSSEEVYEIGIPRSDAQNKFTRERKPR